jgi:DNA primase
MGMDFDSACAKLGVVKERKLTSFRHLSPPKFIPPSTSFPPEVWRKRATAFALESHKNLLNTPFAGKLLEERGFSMETIKAFSLGWNPKAQFLNYPDWGLPISYNQEGKERRLWLPEGIVIPTFSSGDVIKLKIRRSSWKEGDIYPKYVEISGSMKAPSIYGNTNLKVIVLVEAEFDVMLIQQYASDLCYSMAIGGAGKRPDAITDKLLNKADLVLFALDFDDAGKKAFQFWQETYPHLKPWPAPRGKSPESSAKEGTDLRRWVEGGIRRAAS